MSQHNGETANGKALTFDELVRMLSDMVRGADGAERFKAMESLRKVLAPQGQTLEVVLPEPLTAPERIQRLARLHRCCGPLETRLAVQEAFPQAGRGVSELGAEDLPLEAQERVARVRDLKSLFQVYPMLKPARGGRIEGFPASKDRAEKEAWAQGRARAIELERLALASGANRGEGSVEALHAALVDMRALVGIGGQGPYFRGARETVATTCTAVDQLLAGTATYPALPAADAEPAQPHHA